MKKNKFYTIMFILFCFMAATLAGAYFASHTVPTKKNVDKEDKREELLTATDKTTIMIMGVDARAKYNDPGRSDTLMVAMVDPFADKVSLLSVPRDTRVYIEGHGYNKINAAYAFGQEKLAKRTVENFLGINIDHYILIDTKAFVKIIDAIGGIDIDVEKRMQYDDPWDEGGGLHIDLYPGKQHMDGKTAITYVRYRDEYGDIGRVERQQKFMKACMDKLTSPAIITKIPTLVSEVISAIDTDMSATDIIALAGTAAKAQKNGLTTEMVPGDGVYIDDISYWIADMSNMRMMLAKTLGITPSKEVRSRWEESQKEYKSSIPKTATPRQSYDRSSGRETKPKRRTVTPESDNSTPSRSNIENHEVNDNYNYNPREENRGESVENIPREREVPTTPQNSGNTTSVNTARETQNATPPQAQDAEVPTPGASNKTN